MKCAAEIDRHGQVEDENVLEKVTEDRGCVVHEYGQQVQELTGLQPKAE